VVVIIEQQVRKEKKRNETKKRKEKEKRKANPLNLSAEMSRKLSK